MAGHPRQPCKNCGGPKPPSCRGARFCCEACREEGAARAHQEYLARHRKPCEHCGGPKPSSRAIRLCDTCRFKEAAEKCVRCGVNPRRSSHKRLCFQCHTQALDRHAEQRRLWNKLHRGTPVEEPPEEYDDEEYDESLGLRYGIRIPAAPLGRAINQVALRETPFNPVAPSVEKDPTLRTRVVCERADVKPRAVFAWTIGERDGINFYTAIDILTKLDLLWWDVWSEETMRRPILTVVTHAKNLRKKRLAYGPIRHTEYGDRGVDFWALERVRRLFEATSDEEVRQAAFMSPPTPVVEYGCDACREGEPVEELEQDRELVAA